ncbi:energy-coupling factor transporter transmembrane protein EcfT [Waterburya agarophytonicola K14]|uniref:Energy-coupling factor transporter transmembrane protein EcfT n=1 Tax=Waterburya agarophytonicola KI4 TaxID=2874699 RepID=A0A964BQD0_9CYAN|nr:energy-coupling factor transporter transmembrane protein EcfT [Waterburya agarophytonicola]MCC0176917.1 energy-coupling factor transporter transmembrane protein EcfT [Waterburya agarophytonicola KI4]
MDLLRSLPIGSYLEQPVTWLHRIDPRVKLVWLMTFLIAPLLSNPFWRIALAGSLILLTIVAGIPFRVWRKQMGWLLLLCTFMFLFASISPDSLAVKYTPRTPPFCGEISPANNTANNTTKDLAAEKTAQCTSILAPATDYQYVLFDKPKFFLLPRLVITRRSLDVAIRISTLIFTLIYSTSLYLLTTAPEEITEGLDDLMNPLRHFNIPVSEIVLTLTLSLRFIPLVLEEVQNLVRSIRTRAIDWKKLGLRRSAQLWLIVSEKLLENLLLRAEQIAVAMDVRGFTSPNEHRVQWHQLKLRSRDWIALGILIPFWCARWFVGGTF